MFLITSGVQSATWGWAATQLGMNYDIVDALGYVSGTTLTITSLGSGGTIKIGQYAYFFKSNNDLNGTKIVSFGTGTGGLGTYNLYSSQATVGSAGSPIKIGIYSLNLNRPDIESAGATTGDLGFPTMAPNGLIYVPYNITTTTTSTTYLTGFVVIEPGNANTKTSVGVNTSFTRSKIYTVDNDNSGNRPVVVENLSTVNRDRTFTKGILAPNGLLYFIPGRSKTMIVLNPGTGIVNGSPDCTWSLVDFRTATCNANSGTGGTTPIISTIALGAVGHAGGVLDKVNADIYLINASNDERTIRIRPRSSATWTNPNNTSTTSDIFEAGYYNNNGNNLKLVRSVSPVSHLGSLSSNEIYNTANTTLFRGGVIDPNPSSNIIYLTPSRTNIIAYTDPNQWRTFYEVNYDLNSVLNTNTNVPTWSSSNAQSTSNFKYSGLAIGDDKKIYYSYGSKGASASPQFINLSTIGWDIQLDTNYSTRQLFTSRKIFNNKPPSYQDAVQATAIAGSLTPPALLPNKQFLYFGQPLNNGKYQFLTLDTASNASATSVRNALNTSIYFNPAQGADRFTNFSSFMGSNGQAANITTLTKSTQIGKFIVSSRSSSENSLEVMSVKGFFPGVKNFEYYQQVINNLSIPSNLSLLPTHPYNYYGNWT